MFSSYRQRSNQFFQVEGAQSFCSGYLDSAQSTEYENEKADELVRGGCFLLHQRIMIVSNRGREVTRNVWRQPREIEMSSQDCCLIHLTQPCNCNQL